MAPKKASRKSEPIKQSERSSPPKGRTSFPVTSKRQKLNHADSIQYIPSPSKPKPRSAKAETASSPAKGKRTGSSKAKAVPIDDTDIEMDDDQDEEGETEDDFEEIEEPRKKAKDKTVAATSRNSKKATGNGREGKKIKVAEGALTNAESEDEEDNAKDVIVSSPKEQGEHSQDSIAREIVKGLKKRKYNARKKNKDIFAHGLVDLEAIFTSSDTKTARLSDDASSSEGKKETWAKGFETAHTTIAEYRSGLEQFDKFNKQYMAAHFSLQKPVEECIKSRKPILQGLREGLKHCDSRPEKIHQALRRFQEAQESFIEQMEERTKLALDAKQLIKNTRRLIKSAHMSR